jgi:hypothetical protein
MKKTAFLLAAAISIAINAQEDQQLPEIKTLFGNGISHGAYGAFSMGYTTIDNRDVALFGGRGAWIINHSLGIGFGGEGFVSTSRYDNSISSDAILSGGYGGFLLEPILFPKFPVHIAIPILMGAGGAAYSKSVHYNNTHYEKQYEPIDAAPFFFIKPGIELELNMVRFVRLAAGVYYLKTSNVNINSLPGNALSGFSGQLTVKIGIF